MIQYYSEKQIILECFGLMHAFTWLFFLLGNNS